MMNKDKILLNIENLADIEDYTNEGVTNFLFPLEGFSVGYNSFSFEDIAKTGVEAYVLANRLLTDEDIDEFLTLQIPENVRGFIIEDTGLYTVLKEKGYILINFQNHLNANYKTCEYWLKYYDSLVISTDITKEEVNTILNSSSKPLILNTFGYPMIMYSRRALVTNFYMNENSESRAEVTLKDPKGEFTFRLKETSSGTACFDTKILDAREVAREFDENKILFYLVNSSDIPKSDIIKAINGEEVDNTTKGFLDKKTVFRIGDLK